MVHARPLRTSIPDPKRQFLSTSDSYGISEHSDSRLAAAQLGLVPERIPDLTIVKAILFRGR